MTEEFITKSDLIRSWAEIDIKRGVPVATARQNAVDTWNEIEEFQILHATGKRYIPKKKPAQRKEQATKPQSM